MAAGPQLVIREGETRGLRYMTLAGELDLATAPALEHRLNGLLAERALAPADRASVRLDLSELQFIDCTGVHVIFDAIEDANRHGWILEIGAEVTEQVRHVARLTGLDDFLAAVGPAAA